MMSYALFSIDRLRAGAFAFLALLTDAQELLAKRDFSPASRKISTPVHKMPFELVDPRLMLDENDKWNRLYSEIITRQSK